MATTTLDTSPIPAPTLTGPAKWAATLQDPTSTVFLVFLVLDLSCSLVWAFSFSMFAIAFINQDPTKEDGGPLLGLAGSAFCMILYGWDARSKWVRRRAAQESRRGLDLMIVRQELGEHTKLLEGQQEMREVRMDL